MSFWFNDPQLFLYAKGTGPDDVILRRCKKPAVNSSSSSLVVPMKSEDFDYVSNVENHLELIDHQFDWDETDYKRLVKYIYERGLLVNRQGLVFAEIYKLDVANLMVPIYIRSLDVLPLKPYIPNIKERLIPSRTVKYLEDVNGKAAAMMEENDSNAITKLTGRIDDLESKNKTLNTEVTTLTTCLATTTVNVADLESKNKTLDTNVTKLTADLATTTGNVADLQSKNKNLEAENKTLNSNAKTLEGKVTKLTADLVTQMTALTALQEKVKNINPNSKEVWMNDLTNSEWVGVEGLHNWGPMGDFIIVGSPGTFIVDDSSTNVRARYWYKTKFTLKDGVHKAVSLEHLTPNKETSRFSQSTWYTTKSADGKIYVFNRFPI